MAQGKRGIILMALGAIIVFGAIALGVFFFLGGSEEKKPLRVERPTPAPTVAEEAPLDLEGDEVALEENTAKEEKVEMFSNFKVEEPELLTDIAGMPNVYGDEAAWWALFKANPEEVGYVFQDDRGGWIPLVRPGAQLRIPRGDAAAVDEAERRELAGELGTYTVQVNSFVHGELADKMLSELKDGNEDVYVSEYTVEGVPRTRVRIGFYWNKDLARRAGERLKDRYAAVDDFYVVIPTSRETREQQARLLEKYR